MFVEIPLLVFHQIYIYNIFNILYNYLLMITLQPFCIQEDNYSYYIFHMKFMNFDKVVEINLSLETYKPINR